MSELTVALLRLALLALLWIFVFAVVRALRSDLHGTRVVTRRSRRATHRTPMPDDSSPGRPGRQDAPREPRRLVVTSGPMRGATLALHSSPVIIGRNPESSLSIDDDSISGAHARISPDPHGWVIEDLGSTNGTWLDDERLREVVPVLVGSRIRVGQTMLEARA